MRWITPIALTVLWLSFSLAGSPAYAHEEHVADANTHLVAVHVEHDDTCNGDVETMDHYKDGCNKHVACQTTCCLNCGPGVAVLGTPFVLPPSVVKSGAFYPAEHAFLSTCLDSRDRPPKFLS